MNNELQAQNQQVVQQEQPKTLADAVYNKAKKLEESGDLAFPQGYAAHNAMKAAWLKLQNTMYRNRPILEACTQNSVANTLMEMLVQGLDPTKNQCYFIPRGDQLTLEVSYFGVMAITKRVANVREINAQVIYEGDNITYDIIKGRKQNLVHSQAWGNINKENILGAYCILEFQDGSEHVEIMTIDEIRQSWSKSKMNKDKNSEGGTHREYRQEMAKKTVIKRACKPYMNSSNNDDLLSHYIKQTDERAHLASIQEEISTKANQVPVDFIEQVPQYEKVNRFTGEILTEGEVVGVNSTIETMSAIVPGETYHSDAKPYEQERDPFYMEVQPDIAMDIQKVNPDNGNEDENLPF